MGRMKEAYLEIAFQVGKSWGVLSKFIMRSVNAISNLLATLELHLSEDDIVCNRTSEETLQSSRFVVINDLSTRIKKLSSELNSYVIHSFKEHLPNLDKTIKWINDEYSALNHYNSDKDSQVASMKRVQVLHSSLRLCTLVNSDYNFILNSTSNIEANLDGFIQQKLIKPNSNSSPKPTDDPLEKITQITNFNCYNCKPELAIISSYLEENA